MAINQKQYNERAKIWESMDATKQAKFAEQYKNNTAFQEFGKMYVQNNTGKTINPTNWTKTSGTTNMSTSWTVWTPTSTSKVQTTPTTPITSTSSNTITTPKQWTYTWINVAWDTYWDHWFSNTKSPYSWTNTTWTDNYQYDANLKTAQLNDLVFWDNAIARNQTQAWYTEWRNNRIANALYNEWITTSEWVRSYLSRYSDFSSYYQWGQDNTVQAIMNRIGNMQEQASKNIDKNKTTTTPITWDISILWNEDYTAWDFWKEVNRVLKESQWFTLEEMKTMYPEAYAQMYGYLSSVKDTWDATDPNARKQLAWVLQWIIGQWVWYGSDKSKLDRLDEAYLSKFKDKERVLNDAREVQNLATRGMTVPEIAKKMGMSEDQVNQLILLANWDPNSRAWEYYELNKVESKEITEPYDIKKQRLAEEKEIQLDRANRQAERLKEDFDTNMDRAKKQNDINLHNAKALASKYWFAFSNRGIEWLNYIAEQAQNMLDDLMKNYDRSNQEIADGISDIIRQWEWNNDDLIRASEDALNNAKNQYLSNVMQIQQKYWVLWVQAQANFATAVQNFITQAENIYDNALKRQQNNFTNYVNNIANLNALSAQNMERKNAAKTMFMNDVLNVNEAKLEDYAQSNWLDYNDVDELKNYQLQATQNYLNSLYPWAWAQFATQLKELLHLKRTPMEAVQQLMNSNDFKDRVATNNVQPWKTWTWTSAWNWYIFNTASWDTKKIYDTTNNWTSSSSTTWTTTTEWTTTSTWSNSADFISWETIGEQTYWITKQTFEWLQNFMNDEENKVWKTWGECGTFVNKYLRAIWKQWIIKSLVEDKKAIINTPDWYIPQVWDIAIMNSPTSPKYWHVAIVTDVWYNDQWMLTITTLESNKKWEKQVFTRTFSPNVSTSTEVFGYYHPDGVVNANWETSGTQQAYESDIDSTSIARAVYGSTVSDEEWKKVARIVENWKKLWKNATQILYDALWWWNVNEKYTDFAQEMVDIMQKWAWEEWLKAYNLRGLVDLINAGKLGDATIMVENEVMKKLWNKWNIWVTSDSDAIYLINSVQDMVNNIESYGKSKNSAFGRWDAAFNKLLSSMFGEWDNGRKLYNETKSQLANLFNEYRNSIFGSALTEYELNESKKQIPDMSDKLSVFKTKLDSFVKSVLRQANARRTSAWLPTLTIDQLLNPQTRAELYWWAPQWRLSSWGEKIK